MQRRDFLRASTAVGVTAVAANLCLNDRTAELSAGDVGISESALPQTENGVVIHPFEGDVMRGSPPKADLVVTLDTYECSAAHRRWASQHTRELCSTQCIARGGGPVAVLPRRMLEFGGRQFTDPTGSTLTVQQFLAKTYTDAFLILHKGEIITEEYFSGMRPETSHRVYSAGKSVLADVVAILIEKDKLAANACVVEYIPELASSAYAGATVRQLLDMQSGVKYEYDMATPHTSMTEQGRHFRAAGLFRKLPGECPTSGQYDFFVTLDKKCRKHGVVFSYKCSDTGVLTWACERVTGCRFADLVSSHIWSKIGVEHDASIVCDPQGASTPNGGMSTTLRDLARWGQMHLEGGTCRGQRVVPAEFVEDIWVNAEASKVTAESSPPSDFLQPGWAYRSQFWLPEGANGPFCALGGFGQTCYIDPKHDAVIVKFSTHPTLDVELGKLEMHAFREIARSLAI